MTFDGLKPESNLSQIAQRHPTTLALCHSLWAPPNILCLRAAARRLAILITVLPEQFSELHSRGLPTRDQLLDWINWLEADLYGRSSPSDLEKSVAISPVEALQRANGQSVRHPLSGYGMSEFSIFSLLLITPPVDDMGSEGFDRIVAWVTVIGIAEHLGVSLDDYLRFADRFHQYKLDEPEGTSWVKIAPFQLRKQGRLDNARRGIATLQQSEFLSPVIAQAVHADNLDEIIMIIEEAIYKMPTLSDGRPSKEAGHIKSLLTLLNDSEVRERTLRQTKTKDPTSEAKDKASRSNTLSRTSMSTGLRDGTYYTLDSLFLESEAQEEPADSIPVYESEEEDEWEDDLPEVEQRGLPVQEITQVEREAQLEPGTLQVWSQNKLDFTRRLAEYQPYGLDYVCMDIRKEVVRKLSNLLNANVPEPKRVGASFILACIISGRRISGLLRGVLHHDDLAPGISDDLLIIVNMASNTLWLRVNKPELKTAPAPSSIVPGEWIALADNFGLTRTLRPLSATEQLTIRPVIDEILLELLGPYQLKLEQLTQMLPRTMLEREGNFCTASLLTDWSAGNIAVNRHYLTPTSVTVAKRHVAALQSMLDLEGLSIPEQPETFVGHPNTPAVSEVERIIQELSRVTTSMSLEQRHNQIAIHTIILLSLSIGLRATVNIEPGGIQLLDKNIAHFTEKGFTRLVCLPELLAEQLVAYQQHLSLLDEIWQRRHGAKPHSNLFFIFDKNGTPEPFAPGRLNEYLLDLGVVSDIDVRGLRRMVFTWLYEHGGFGRAIDHFISHAVNGSQAFVLHSGVQIGDLHKIAMFINEKLNAMHFPISPGINHHHVAFRA